MAKKGTTPGRSSAKAVTADRAARLYRLLKLLEDGPHTREELTRQLRLDVRGFYRDLELLRECGIHLALRDHHYSLPGAAGDAVARLPFPDPHLNLGEAQQLAKGRSTAHRKLKGQVDQILQPPARRKRKG
jgi:predicted DNA-binding transcriptional regulator YafY